MNLKSPALLAVVVVSSCYAGALQAQTRPATSAVTASTCLEKLVSGASKERCEQVKKHDPISQQTQRRSEGFLAPRSPGNGVATAPESNAFVARNNAKAITP